MALLEYLGLNQHVIIAEEFPSPSDKKKTNQAHEAVNLMFTLVPLDLLWVPLLVNKEPKSHEILLFVGLPEETKQCF